MKHAERMRRSNGSSFHESDMIGRDRVVGPASAGPPAAARRSLRRALLVYLDTAFLATLVVVLAVAGWAEHRSHLSSIDRHLEGLASTLAGVLPVGDRESAEWLTALESHLGGTSDLVQRLVVYRGDGRIAWDSAPERPLPSPQDEGWRTSQARAPDGRTLALFGRDSADRLLLARLAMTLGICVLLGSLVFGVLLRLVLDRHVSRPVQQLVAHIEDLEHGRTVTDDLPERDDELAWLAHRFAEMAGHVQSTTRERIRSEKRATASIVATRVLRDLREPVAALAQHIAFLESLYPREPELRRIVTAIREDRSRVLQALREIGSVVPAADESRAEKPIERR